MKKICILILVVLTFISCKKDKLNPNSAEATINGIEWSGSTYVQGLEEDEKNFSLVMFDANENGFLLLNHLYTNIPKKVGRYELGTAPWNREGKVGSGFWFLEDDLILATYQLIETDSLTNHLTVDSYNEETKEVKGSFQSTFTLRPPNTFNQVDTVRVMNGSFSVVIDYHQ